MASRDHATGGDLTAAPAPEGTSVRRPTPADLDRVAALYRRSAAARGTDAADAREELRHRWREPHRLDDALLVEDGAGALLAYAEFHEDLDPWTGELELYLEVRIDPDAPAAVLLGFVHDRADRRARLAVVRGGHTAGVLRTTVEEPDTGAGDDLRRRGFSPARHFLRLRLDLDAERLPFAEVPRGIRIRRFRPGEDDRAFHAAMQAGFADHWGHVPLDYDEWRYLRLERDPTADPRRWLVAARDAAGTPAVVGGAICRHGIPEDPGLGYVEELAVRPGHRRRGIALALLRVAFRRFRRAGLRRAGLEVDDVTLHGALRLYERAGMTVAHRTDVWERPVRA